MLGPMCRLGTSGNRVWSHTLFQDVPKRHIGPSIVALGLLVSRVASYDSYWKALLEVLGNIDYICKAASNGLPTCLLGPRHPEDGSCRSGSQSAVRNRIHCQSACITFNGPSQNPNSQPLHPFSIRMRGTHGTCHVASM